VRDGLPHDPYAARRSRRAAGRKQAHFDPVVKRVAPSFGALFSITAATADGLLIINVWEDAEPVRAFTALPEMQHAQTDAQLPPPGSFQRYPDALVDVFDAPADAP
jgi:hypothetical protein